MGLLKNIVGDENYPALPSDSYAVKRIQKIQDELRELASETNDRLEVVPAQHSAYVFIGKPPKKFGMAWITDGRIANLGELAKEKNFSPITLEKIEDELAAAYRRSEGEQRFNCDVGDQRVVVIPSEDLESEVHRTIQALLK